MMKNISNSEIKENKMSSAVRHTLYWGKRFVVGFSLIAMVTTQAGAESFIKKTMDDFLHANTMTNITSASAFKTATRGVVSGGSIQARNPIFNSKLISFVPPTLNSSCNGLDMFLGSFSFINADELVQLFRSIASNALGFLFHLALNVVSALISNLMQKFSDIVREINKLVSDSCQMAQGIVTYGLDTLTGYDSGSKGRASLESIKKSFGDIYENFFPKDSGTGAISSKAKQSTYFLDEAIRNGEVGNFMWLAMKQNFGIDGNRSLAARLRTIGATNMEEEIMSLTGFLVAEPTKKGIIAGSSDSTTEEYTEQKQGDRILTIKALIEGGANTGYKVYKCTDGKDYCLKPEPTEDPSAKGLAQLMYKSLCGTEDLNEECSSSSLLAKLSNNNGGNGGDLTDEEKAAIFSLPSTYRSLITDLQILSTGATKADDKATSAGTLIQRHIRFLALNVVERLVNEILAELRAQVNGFKGSAQEVLLKKIKEAEQANHAEIESLSRDFNYGDLRTVQEDIFNELKVYQTIPNASAVAIQTSKVGGYSKD